MKTHRLSSGVIAVFIDDELRAFYDPVREKFINCNIDYHKRPFILEQLREKKGE